MVPRVNHLDIWGTVPWLKLQPGMKKRMRDKRAGPEGRMEPRLHLLLTPAGRATLGNFKRLHLVTTKGPPSLPVPRKRGTLEESDPHLAKAGGRMLSQRLKEGKGRGGDLAAQR